MPKIITLFLFILIAGCAVKPKPTTPQFTAPSVDRVVAPIAEAKAKAAAIRLRTVDFQTVRDLEAIESRLEDAQRRGIQLKSEIDAQAALLNTSIDEKNLALQQSEYWQEKQAKALKELWVYRSISIGILSLAVLFVLIKLGIIGSKLFL